MDMHPRRTALPGRCGDNRDLARRNGERRVIGFGPARTRWRDGDGYPVGFILH
jgi:hypothetical protein